MALDLASRSSETATADVEAPIASPEPRGSGAAILAQVQAIKAQGWEAVEQVAGLVRDRMDAWPTVAAWLHKNRGNDFVQHVTAEVSGKPAANAATKFPIVLLPGFNSGAGEDSFDPGIIAAMKGDGDAVFEVTSPPFASVEERAKQIAPQLQQILDKTHATKLNLIAHSLGGLDARYLISTMGWADRVASLSTVGTPHKGTPIADTADRLVPHAADGALDKLAQLVGHKVDHNPMADNADARGTMRSLSEGNAAEFNKENPNDPGVYYQSWAGVSTMSGKLSDKDLAALGKRDESMQPQGADPHVGDKLPLELYPSSLMAKSKTNGNLNDGAVPVESAEWGNYQGAVPADHIDLVRANPANKARTGFDVVEFYKKMAQGLSKRGY